VVVSDCPTSDSSFDDRHVEKLGDVLNKVDVGMSRFKDVVESTLLARDVAVHAPGPTVAVFCVVGPLQGVSRNVAKADNIAAGSIISKRPVVMISRAVGAFVTFTVTSPGRQNTVFWETKVLMYNGAPKLKTVAGPHVNGYSPINAA
jgi:hypothetical protein